MVVVHCHSHSVSGQGSRRFIHQRRRSKTKRHVDQLRCNACGSPQPRLVSSLCDIGLTTTLGIGGVSSKFGEAGERIGRVGGDVIDELDVCNVRGSPQPCLVSLSCSVGPITPSALVVSPRRSARREKG